MKRTPYTKFWSKRRDIRRVSRRRQLKEQARLSAGGNRVENKNNPCTYRREEIEHGGRKTQNHGEMKDGME